MNAERGTRNAEQVFFITGLPRTRSAWLANLFTFGHPSPHGVGRGAGGEVSSFCLHDTMAEGLSDGRAELPLRLHSESRHLFQEGYTHAGFADTGLGYCHKELSDEFPAAKWIIIWRPVNEAAVAFHEFLRRAPYPGLVVPGLAVVAEQFEYLDGRLHQLVDALPASQVRTAGFAELESEATAESLWRFLFAGSALPVPRSALPWSPRRWQQLHALRLETIPAKRFHPSPVTPHPS